MNDSNKQIFDTLTEPQNFRTVLAILKRFEIIKDQLLIDFWTMVRIKMDELIGKNGNIWKTSLEDVLGRDAMLWLYKSEWVYDISTEYIDLGVCYSELAKKVGYGIWIDEAHGSQRQNLETMRDYFKKRVEFSNFEKTKWFPLYDYTDYDFSLNDNLEHILPGKTEELAQQFAVKLFDFALKLESDLDKMFMLKKVSKKKSD